MAHLGAICVILGQCWPILARLWLFWGSLGTLLGHLDAILDHLKAILEESWTFLNPGEARPPWPSLDHLVAPGNLQERVENIHFVWEALPPWPPRGFLLIYIGDLYFVGQSTFEPFHFIRFNL